MAPPLDVLAPPGVVPGSSLVYGLLGPDPIWGSSKYDLTFVYCSRYIDPIYVIISLTYNSICPLIYYDHKFCLQYAVTAEEGRHGQPHFFCDFFVTQGWIRLTG